jgi:hypothetical protein
MQETKFHAPKMQQGKITVLWILMFTFLDNEQEDNLWTKW